MLPTMPKLIPDVGIKFILLEGHWVGVVLPELEARRYIKDYINGTLPPRIGNPDHPMNPWAIRTDLLSAIHVFNASDMDVQNKPSVTRPGYPGGTSGLNN